MIRVPAIMVTVFAVALAIGGPASAAGLFGTSESRSTNMKMFTKWTDAVQRSYAEAKAKAGSCDENDFNSCHYVEWRTFLDGLEGLAPREQVDKVNAYLNEAPYITDPDNWGEQDYWTSPAEFLARNGDCEDYAIAKFFSLRQLGFPAEAMRIVAVKDLNLGVGHAILAVWLNDEPLILDNQIKQVVPHTTIRHYQPVFSINESAWWRHR